MSSAKEVFRAIKTAWDGATFSSTFYGPYRDRKPPNLSVGYPYVVFTSVANTRRHTTCDNEHWLSAFRLIVRGKTPESVEDVVDDIAEKVDAFSLSISPGGVIYLRRIREFYTEETDQSVYLGALDYDILREKPRLDI